MTYRRLLASLVLALPACTDGASNDPGADTLMQIASAQFVREELPDAGRGPDVESIDLATNTIWPNYWNKLIKGALGESATACAVRLEGDSGYWIVVAGVPDVATPKFPSVRATARFSSTLSAGEYNLELRAIDALGQFGAPRTQRLTAVPSPPSQPTSNGALVIALSWDTPTDLDLHVVDPAGSEIFHGATRSDDGLVSSPHNQAGVGVLQYDSNAGCSIDGRQQEVIVWASQPPPGTYQVRVDTVSLCGQPIAHWKLDVSLDGVVLQSIRGTSLDSDTWGLHGRGAGLLALTFGVP